MFIFWVKCSTYSLWADKQKSTIFASKFNNMKNYRELVREYGFDFAVWKRFYHQHQIGYIRQRLWVVRHFSEGMCSSKVAKEMAISADNIVSHILKMAS